MCLNRVQHPAEPKQKKVPGCKEHIFTQNPPVGCWFLMAAGWTLIRFFPDGLYPVTSGEASPGTRALCPPPAAAGLGGPVGTNG